MDVTRIVIILLHPLLALALLGWIIWQHRWSTRGLKLKGEERANALNNHEVWGKRIFPAAIGVVLVAFAADIWTGYTEDGDWLPHIYPSSVHGILGLFGLILLTITWRMGNKVVTLRDSGEKWSLDKTKHGRAADLIVILAIIHAFIGFLYIFENL